MRGSLDWGEGAWKEWRHHPEFFWVHLMSQKARRLDQSGNDVGVNPVLYRLL